MYFSVGDVDFLLVVRFISLMQKKLSQRFFCFFCSRFSYVLFTVSRPFLLPFLLVSGTVFLPFPAEHAPFFYRFFRYAALVSNVQACGLDLGWARHTVFLPFPSWTAPFSYRFRTVCLPLSTTVSVGFRPHFSAGLFGFALLVHFLFPVSALCWILSVFLSPRGFILISDRSSITS